MVLPGGDPLSSRNNTAEQTLYYHVVAHLHPDLADELDVVLVAFVSDAAYDRVEEGILHRTTDLDSSRLRQLLNAAELGDHGPTKLLHLMRQLLGPPSPDSHNDILRDSLVQRPPTTSYDSRISLQCHWTPWQSWSTGLKNNQLVYLFGCSPDAAIIASLHENIQDLTAVVEALQLAHPRRERSSLPSPARQFPSARRLPERICSVSPDPHESSTCASVCWYHCFFVAQARRSQDPCHWQENT